MPFFKPDWILLIGIMIQSRQILFHLQKISNTQTPFLNLNVGGEIHFGSGHFPKKKKKKKKKTSTNKSEGNYVLCAGLVFPFVNDIKAWRNKWKRVLLGKVHWRKCSSRLVKNEANRSQLQSR